MQILRDSINYCSNCGIKIDHTWNACPNCGVMIVKQKIPSYLYGQSRLAPQQQRSPYNPIEYEDYGNKALFYGIAGIFASMIPIIGIIFGILAIYFGVKSDKGGSIALGIITILLSIFCALALIWYTNYQLSN